MGEPVEKHVMVAMSGGVDSATAALLLLQQGYQVQGMTLDTGFDEAGRAAALCKEMGIPHAVVDVREEFRHWVMDSFVDVYAAGMTPNPCIQCNIRIKFPYLVKAADQAGCALIATGHYARVQDGVLFRAEDRNKDQSYVLYGLPRSTLLRLLLPLGNLSKPQVRALASDADLENADAPESQDICFVSDGDHLAFLHSYGLQDEPGDIVDLQGQVLGTHQGLAAYTIGQRRGLGIGGGEPLFVLEKDKANNRLVVGNRQQLAFSSCTLSQVNWLSEELPGTSIPVMAKVRYRSDAQEAWFDPVSNLLTFPRPVDALAPGQAAVLYGDGEQLPQDRVLGGGTISTVQHAGSQLG